MRFCSYCSSNMSKSTATGAIVFHCRCQIQINGDPADTLMFEELLETSESNLKHEVFIENSAFDPARNIVMKDCPQCGLDFLTMIRVGVNEVIMYSCSCSFRATGDEYNKRIAAAPKKSEFVEKKE